MRVIVTGGTGFIGARLCDRLLAKGHEVVVLTRDASRAQGRVHPNARLVAWGAGATDWTTLVDGAGAIVNLAGESVARPWTAHAKAQIVRSRLGTTERLYEAIRKVTARPGAVLNASAIGYYGPRADEELTEDSGPGHDFLAQTCVEWEAAARKIESLGPRVVRFRIGIVLSKEGGALGRMLLPFKLGLGGPLGSGRQWMSWVHRDDLVELFAWALETPTVTGVLNGTAPLPVRMQEFATALGKVLHRPSVIPVPAVVLRLALGEASTIVLDGQRVLPKRALALGFSFRFSDVTTALRDAVRH